MVDEAGDENRLSAGFTLVGLSGEYRVTVGALVWLFIIVSFAVSGWVALLDGEMRAGCVAVACKAQAFCSERF